MRPLSVKRTDGSWDSTHRARARAASCEDIVEVRAEVTCVVRGGRSVRAEVAAGSSPGTAGTESTLSPCAYSPSGSEHDLNPRATDPEDLASELAFLRRLAHAFAAAPIAHAAETCRAGAVAALSTEESPLT
ncbi:hypothetical protein GCM10010299_44940 [Streptomyces tanashiensis]|nr:hypothetical protein GCM10010299_44940 [Streptomyces tanashiensis]